MRRNDVVTFKDGNYAFYGRIVKRVGPDHVMWICSGLHIHVSKVSELEVQAYKGKSEFMPGLSINYFHRHPNGELNFSAIKFQRPARFIPMTSLRRLKQMAARFHGRDAWNTSTDYEYLRFTPTSEYPVGSATKNRTH
jgi:hypothetical protein